jgi:hypothetical protein
MNLVSNPKASPTATKGVGQQLSATLAPLLKSLRELTHKALALLDAKPPRERAALAALAIAGLVATELFVVLPIRSERAALAAAVLAQKQDELDAEQAQRDQWMAEQTAIEARLVHVAAELRERGAAAAQGESLALWLQRALADQAVKVVALRDLGMQEIETTPSAPAAHDSTDAATTTTAAPSADKSHPPLYRHRYELTVCGPVPHLTGAVQALAGRMLPLRIERVRLASVADGTEVRATLVFTIITAERTWITL